VRRHRVIITPQAADDIRAAHAYYFAENPTRAAAWLDGLEAAILGLETHPFAHPLAPEGRAFKRDIHHLLYGRKRLWRIFYAIGRSTVHVLHVRHASRDRWRP